MKVQLESIKGSDDCSFSMLFNPRLSDLFFWHFHPEYEIVFIDGTSGTRHVGEHTSTYDGSDLVMIGSNIPHLNFDFGVKSDYRKVVLHMKREFLEHHFSNIRELKSVRSLIESSKKGIAFNGPEKRKVGNMLFDMEGLSSFNQYLKIIEILHELAKIQDFELLHHRNYDTSIGNKEHQRLQKIYAFVDSNYQRKIELKEVAELSFMTKEAFCRYFKKMTQYTFIEFLNRYRISQSKRLLMSGFNVSEACFESGFESLSYYNRIFKRITNENPREFRKRYV